MIKRNLICLSFAYERLLVTPDDQWPQKIFFIKFWIYRIDCIPPWRHRWRQKYFTAKKLRNLSFSIFAESWFLSKMTSFMTSSREELYKMNHQLYFKHQFGSIEHSGPPGGSRDLIQSENKILKLFLSGASRWPLMTDDVELMFKMNSMVHSIKIPWYVMDDFIFVKNSIF